MGKILSKCGSTLVVCLMLLGATASQAGTIFGSKHDLSGDATYQVCGFCHTPHNASTQAGLADAPLWNRRITNLDEFIPYTSPTMTQTCPTRPSGISLACLSCHDGTQAQASGTQPSAQLPNYSASRITSAVEPLEQHNAINQGVSAPITYQSPGSITCGKCHGGIFGYPGQPDFSAAVTNMAGPDLSDDHPISMPYPTANPANFIPPPNPTTGWSDLKLFNGRVECPTCHNPHDPTNIPFLRASNDGSAICLRCHNK